MAEAYNHLGNYDYANYTFQQSLKSNYLNFPKKAFHIEDFISSPLENEHFDVEVSIDLFNIAKKKKPY